VSFAGCIGAPADAESEGSFQYLPESKKKEIKITLWKSRLFELIFDNLFIVEEGKGPDLVCGQGRWRPS